MIKFKHIATVYFISHQVLQTNGFVQDGSFLRSNPLSQSLLQIKGQHSSKEPRGVALSMAKLWERMEIEEDPEPFWYVLNCVAGLEIDLLRQCRQRCEDMKDVEKLRSMKLALGGSLKNAVVLDDTKILNEDGLRFSDEFVRHKVLDFIGDLSLSGYRMLGSFYTSHSGHSLNNILLNKIFESKSQKRTNTHVLPQ